MKKKSLNSLALNSQTISNLSSLKHIVGGEGSPGCSIQEQCEPQTDVGNGASCTCLIISG